jgi:S-(hydroxymethyl)glutathione dehydrogenase/alcohol dehydrogenase
MRAAVLREVHGGLHLEDLRTPSPHYGEVLVDVAACGVCHTDLHVMKGEVAFPIPAVLGHEVSGIVAGVGMGVTNVKEGDRVVASFILPCGTCQYCVRGEDDLCETFFNYNRLRGTLYDGETRLFSKDGSPISMYSMGGFAEQCVITASDVFVVPDALSLRDVATVGCSALTAYGAVRNVADLHPGDTVAIVATGGVGSAIIQVAKAFGASRIIAIDIDDKKLDAARTLGATDTINARDIDGGTAVMELTGGRGVDIAFEAFGSAATFATAAASVGNGGTVVVVGIAPAGVTGAIDLARLPRRKIRILGSYGARPRSDMPTILSLLERGAWVPNDLVSAHYGLDEVDDAYGALGRGEIVGRAVVDISSAR